MLERRAGDALVAERRRSEDGVGLDAPPCDQVVGEPAVRPDLARRDMAFAGERLVEVEPDFLLDLVEGVLPAGVARQKPLEGVALAPRVRRPASAEAVVGRVVRGAVLPVLLEAERRAVGGRVVDVEVLLVPCEEVRRVGELELPGPEEVEGHRPPRGRGDDVLRRGDGERRRGRGALRERAVGAVARLAVRSRAVRGDQDVPGPLDARTEDVPPSGGQALGGPSSGDLPPGPAPRRVRRTA